jgi:hypothetical protein
MFGGWRTTNQHFSQFVDPYITIVLYKTGFVDTKVSASDPKMPLVEKQ